MTLATVPRYDRDQTYEWGERAVVVGAGVAGLLAARVLADGFGEVVVVDRDPLPDEAVARRGVPQANHIHILLEAGYATLEDLFPAYGEELLSAGGLVIDASRDVNFYMEGDFLADRPRRLPIYCASRPLYEQVLRRRVAELDGVELRSGSRFIDYLVDEAAKVVNGVAVAREGSTEDIAADLVVDATGRTSRTPTWLERHGYAAPALDEVRIDLGYSTALFERPADDRREFVVAASPTHARGGSVHAVEGDRWIVTLFGVHGDYPPDDPAGFADFAASLPTPEVKQLLDEHRQVSEEITHYRFPANRRHRYEDLDRFPEGLVVTGDAIASFNPVYAQGMSVAALEALVLHHSLSAGGRRDLARRFFGQSSRIVDDAWNMAVGSDHQFRETVGPKPRGSAVMNRYLSRLARKAHADPVLSDAFFGVLMMTRPPSSLLRPGVAARVLKPTRPDRSTRSRLRHGAPRPK